MIVHLPDLTVNEVSRSYTYYLEEKLGKIYSMSVSRSVPLEAMRRNIFNYIYDAQMSYPTASGKVYTKKKWFLDQVNSIDDKKQLYWLCRNSVMKARRTEAKLRG